MSTKVKYGKSETQKDSEKISIIDVIKQEVPRSSSGRIRGIKLPEYISFDIEDATLIINIHEFPATCEDGSCYMKNPTCENMQTDNAAFEGWAICLKCWLKEVRSVKLTWALPSKESRNLHYNRFIYRVLRFSDAFSDWFSISEKNKKEIEDFKKEFCDLRNNSYRAAPQEKKKNNTFGETEMEFLMANSLAPQMNSYFGIEFIDRQFPIGIKKSGKQFFTGGMSAIDLWGMGCDSATIIELKYGNKNIKVGIISELFLYACVVRDIVRGIILPPKSTPKKSEETFYSTASSIYSINANMLATDYHLSLIHI